MRHEDIPRWRRWAYTNDQPYPHLYPNKFCKSARGIAAITLVLVVSIGGLITGGVFGFNQLARQVSVESCHNWGAHNGRVTKWASYNLFSYECLTRAYDGKWVSTDYPQQFIPLNVNVKGKS